MPRKYSDEFKREIIHRYERGESVKFLSQKLHIAQSTLYRWIRAFCRIETSAYSYTPAEFDKLIRSVQKLEHMLEIIRQSGLIAGVPLQERLALLEGIHQKEKYSVHELCEALEVARGTFYNHIYRWADQSAHELEQAELIKKAQLIFDDSGQRYGAEKIRIVLAENGIHVGKRRILTIMQELDIMSIRTDAKRQYKKRQREQKKNWLERDFTADHPNQIWVSDITHFRVGDNHVYLCIILDLFSRRIVGHHIAPNASTNLVTTTFRRAYEERGKQEGLTFHSDRGVQYTSKTMTELLRKNGIRQSFSATGSPHDNAVAEAFFANFKKEDAYRRDYTSINAFRKSTNQYIHFYNEIRLHQALKYKTPQGFEDAYLAKMR